MNPEVEGVVVGAAIGLLGSLIVQCFVIAHQIKSAYDADRRRIRDQKADRLRNACAAAIEAAYLFNDHAVDVFAGTMDPDKLQQAEQQANRAITLLTLEVEGGEIIRHLADVTAQLRKFKQATDMVVSKEKGDHRSAQNESWAELRATVDVMTRHIKSELKRLEEPI